LGGSLIGGAIFGIARMNGQEREGLRQAARSLISAYIIDDPTDSELLRLSSEVDKLMEKGLTPGDLRSVLARLEREGDNESQRRLLKVSRALKQI
jgi:hypothetical protein